ncbi:MAG: cache domain-containing protein [Deltaproteobacteria bacterium]|nr:cache domain-containing protein [Deltaproteobacteria bacterium]
MPQRLFWLENCSILVKIIGINLAILLVASLAIIFHIIPVYEQNLLRQYKSHTSNLVDIASSVLNNYNSKVLRHEMTLDEAQASAIESIRVMANRNDYLWIQDLEQIMVVHPFAPQLEGKNVADFKDASGKMLFVEMNRLVKTQGQGFLEYLWPKPGHAAPVPKISYIKLFEPWGWVVGSGVYYDDVKQESAELRRQVLMTSSVLLALIICFSLYAARRINLPLKKALLITHQITHPHLPASEAADISDEPSLLLDSIETIVTELKGAKDEAERANRAKSDFLARMSHEIRTPMNAVVGMTELAMESATTLEQKEYLEGVRSSAEHLTALINDILDFSKIEAGRLALEQIPFSLRDTLNASGQLLAYRARQKGLSFEVNVSPDLPDRLLGDPVRLRQIITNLTGNAIKFTGRGGITITAAEVAREDGEVLAAIYVRDTGMGIPREVQELIFEPFVQADGSTARQFGGTGLGLPIVRQLVEMMGGGVSVASEPGLGSEFRFTARFRLAEEQASIPDDCPDERPAVARQVTGSRVLSWRRWGTAPRWSQTAERRCMRGAGEASTWC